MYQNSATAFDFAATVSGFARFNAVIVVPCFNEAKRLDTAAFSVYLQQTPNVRFLFVDDGSTDATAQVLMGMKEANPNRVDVVSLAVNQGKAEAVRQGLLRAVDMGSDVVGYWDADLATPLDAIEDFMRVANRVKSAQIIFGSRRRLMGHRIHRTLDRRIISRCCSIMARVALSMAVSDTQCGAKMMRVNDVLRAALEQPFRTAWMFDVELFARLRRKDGHDCERFYELPLCEWTEVPGSKVSSKAVMRAASDMVQLIIANRFRSAAA